MLARVEWDFNAVSDDDELLPCCYWEYARESARIRAFCSPKDSDFFPAPEMQPEIKGPDGGVFLKARRRLVNPARARFAQSLWIYALPVKLMLDRVFGTKADPFEKAWVNLRSSFRKAVVQELKPYFAEKPSLPYLPFNRCSDLRDIGLADENYRCAKFDEELGIERLRVEIDWGGFTDAQIVRAFKLWVANNRPSRVGTADERGLRKQKGYRVYLFWLGTMRLMNICPFTRIKMEIPDAWSQRRSEDWPRARKKAISVFKSLFPFLPEEDFPIHSTTTGGRRRQVGRK